MSKYTFENYNEFESTINSMLRSRFEGLLVSHRKYGTGNVRDIKLREVEADISVEDCDAYITVKFDKEEKTFLLKTAIECGALEINMVSPEEIKEIFDNLSSQFEKRITELNIELVKLREQEALERARQEEELKFELRKQKALAKLKELRPENTEKLFDTPVSQYEVLGWMAKHITSIKPSMPDYMEKWFTSKFGDVERYVVDSRKRTSGGFQMQWGLSCKVSFDTKVVGPLARRATSNPKSIDNLAFVWDLVDNYGFQFGKKQDIEKIRKEVPTQYLIDFERGLAM